MFSIPCYVRAVLENLEDSGYEAYLVGGCIRDFLLSKRPGDFDVATNAKPDEVKRIFSKAILVGERFGTVAVIVDRHKIEVTTYRSDGEYEDGRHPKQVTLVSSLEEDCLRRDFTINALAWNLREGVVDYTGGVNDIEQKVIRAVGEPGRRFSEDALRILRAYRFSCQLGFSIEGTTRREAIRLAGKITAVSGERVREELFKILSSERPEGIYTLWEDGILPYRAQRTVLKKLPVKLRFARYYLSVGEEDREAFRKRLKLSKEINRRLCGMEALAGETPDITPVGIKRLLLRFGKETVLDYGRIACPKLYTQAKRILNAGEPYLHVHLSVGGDELRAAGIGEGIIIGKTLDMLLAHCMEHPEDNEREILLKLALNNEE